MWSANFLIKTKQSGKNNANGICSSHNNNQARKKTFPYSSFSVNFAMRFQPFKVWIMTIYLHIREIYDHSSIQSRMCAAGIRWKINNALTTPFKDLRFAANNKIIDSNKHDEKKEKKERSKFINKSGERHKFFMQPENKNRPWKNSIRYFFCFARRFYTNVWYLHVQSRLKS